MRVYATPTPQDQSLLHDDMMWYFNVPWSEILLYSQSVTAQSETEKNPDAKVKTGRWNQSSGYWGRENRQGSKPGNQAEKANLSSKGQAGDPRSRVQWRGERTLEMGDVEGVMDEHRLGKTEVDSYAFSLAIGLGVTCLHFGTFYLPWPFLLCWITDTADFSLIQYAYLWVMHLSHYLQQLQQQALCGFVLFGWFPMLALNKSKWIIVAFQQWHH